MKRLGLLMIVFGFACTGCGLGKPTDVLLIKYDDSSMMRGQIIKTNASIKNPLYEEE